jgi:hypothetical protein
MWMTMPSSASGRDTKRVFALLLLSAGSAVTVATVTRPAMAQEAAELSVDVGECVRLRSAAERFACYEQHVNEALTNAPEEAAESQTAGEASDRPADGTDDRPVDDAGGRPASAREARDERPARGPEPRDLERVPELTIESGDAPAARSLAARPSGDGDPAERAGRTSRQQEAVEDDASGEYVGTIASLRERLPNQYLITLDNGQIWRQVYPEHYRLQLGHQVRIYPTKWGTSYRLTVEELHGFIQVERVR